MKFKAWLEITSTANVAGFQRMCIPQSRRMWPPSIATMVDDNPPGKKKKKEKVYRVPQVEESTDGLEEAILRLLQQSTEGLQIGEMIKSLGLDPSVTFQDQEGWSFGHGHRLIWH